MTKTRPIVPRVNGDSSVGVPDKHWGKSYIDEGHFKRLVADDEGHFKSLVADNGTIAGRNLANDGVMLATHESEITNLQSQITTLEHAYAGAKAAATVADMKDHNQVYVYVGSESGYTNGNWYYWNGTAWTSGGVYNSTALETDKTLSVSGGAADALATGTKIKVPSQFVTHITENDSIGINQYTRSRMTITHDKSIIGYDSETVPAGVVTKNTTGSIIVEIPIDSNTPVLKIPRCSMSAQWIVFRDLTTTWAINVEKSATNHAEDGTGISIYDEYALLNCPRIYAEGKRTNRTYGYVVAMDYFVDVEAVSYKSYTLRDIGNAVDSVRLLKNKLNLLDFSMLNDCRVSHGYLNYYDAHTYIPYLWPSNTTYCVDFKLGVLSNLILKVKLPSHGNQLYLAYTENVKITGRTKSSTETELVRDGYYYVDVDSLLSFDRIALFSDSLEIEYIEKNKVFDTLFPGGIDHYNALTHYPMRIAGYYPKSPTKELDKQPDPRFITLEVETNGYGSITVNADKSFGGGFPVQIVGYYSSHDVMNKNIGEGTNGEKTYSLAGIRKVWITINSLGVFGGRDSLKFNGCLTPKSEHEPYKNMDIILPSALRVIDGVGMNMYHQNFCRYVDTNKISGVTVNGADNYTSFSKIRGGNGTIWANIFTDDTQIASMKKSITLHSVSTNAGKGMTKKVMLLGDSLTDNGDYTSKALVELFDSDSMNIKLIGTEGTAPAVNEGRSGWRAYTYDKCADQTDDKAMGLSTSRVNPFWNSSTQKFDFTYYMNTKGFNGVDYVFICLGTNDIARGNFNSDTEIISYWDDIIDSIKAYNSNVKIGIWLPPTRALYENNSKTAINSSLRMNKLLIDTYDNRENENLYLVPVYLNVDPYNDYNGQEISTDSRSTTKIKISTDNVHPSVVGYNKIADVIYAYVKYFGELDE